MLKINGKFLYTLLILSIGFNILVLCVDTIPFVYSRLENQGENVRINNRAVNNDDLEKQVVKKAMQMVKSNNVTMVWNDQEGFTKTLASWVVKGKQSDFKTFNYPRAFLYFGLSEYFIDREDTEGLELLKKSFDGLITKEGEPTFPLDKVDQVPFGLSAMNFYSFYDEEKYRHFYERIYQYIKDSRNEKGIILYRQDANSQLNDVLGMIVPFLVDYYKRTNDSTALKIAKDQMDFFIQYGLDTTFIPAHGISLPYLTKVGSINWGRGIGWYLIGLSAIYNATGDYEEEFLAIYDSLNKLKLDNNLYSQYPGSTKRFDASTSSMFLYSFNFLDRHKRDEDGVLALFAPYIESDGSVIGTSGDTYGLNSYSKSFGKSELTQGILLLLLANQHI